MDFMLDCPIPDLKPGVDYKDPILLTGSCFTEHIGNTLRDLKFDVLQNPNGIVFDPSTVTDSLIAYIENRPLKEDSLFFLNELWQSWQHHSSYSGTDAAAVLEKINASQARAHHFLRKAKWLIITLGTSFSYRLSSQAPGSPAAPIPVANCHRAPAAWFHKHMMTIEETNAAFDHCLHRLFAYNPDIRVIFTVSPVRHVRDGVVENNRSKARLIEVVHHIVGKFNGVYYFPAYELVIDVLRDYRFYDIDLVHPNYAATSYVLERFTSHFIDPGSRALMEEVKKIMIARKHKPFQPTTQAHLRFLRDHREKTEELQRRCPFLDFREELAYFSV